MNLPIAVEWGLWNNSWVKNLPVRPLAPRRKTPGQLYPAFNDLPGWVRMVLDQVPALKKVTGFTVSINNYDCINTKPGIHCRSTLMIPSSSAASLLLDFELLCCEIDELRTSNAKSVVLLCLRRKKKEFIIIHWKLICDSNDDFWLVGIYSDRDKQRMYQQCNV